MDKPVLGTCNRHCKPHERGSMILPCEDWQPIIAPLRAEQPHVHGCLYSGRPHPGQSCRFPAGVIFCPKGCGVLEVVEEPNGIACTRCGYCLHKEPAQPTELERKAYVAIMPMLLRIDYSDPALKGVREFIRAYEAKYPEAGWKNLTASL